jgi:hypothetical protein
MRADGRADDRSGDSNRASATELVDAILRVASGHQYADPDLGAQLAVNGIW